MSFPNKKKDKKMSQPGNQSKISTTKIIEQEKENLEIILKSQDQFLKILQTQEESIKTLISKNTQLEMKNTQLEMKNLNLRKLLIESLNLNAIYEEDIRMLKEEDYHKMLEDAINSEGKETLNAKIGFEIIKLRGYSDKRRKFVIERSKCKEYKAAYEEFNAKLSSLGKRDWDEFANNDKKVIEFEEAIEGLSKKFYK